MLTAAECVSLMVSEHRQLFPEQATIEMILDISVAMETTLSGYKIPYALKQTIQTWSVE